MVHAAHASSGNTRSLVPGATTTAVTLRGFRSMSAMWPKMGMPPSMLVAWPCSAVSVARGVDDLSTVTCHIWHTAQTTSGAHAAQWFAARCAAASLPFAAFSAGACARAYRAMHDNEDLVPGVTGPIEHGAGLIILFDGEQRHDLLEGLCREAFEGARHRQLPLEEGVEDLARHLVRAVAPNVQVARWELEHLAIGKDGDGARAWLSARGGRGTQHGRWAGATASRGERPRCNGRTSCRLCTCT